MADPTAKLEEMVKALAEALILTMVSNAMSIKMTGKLVAGDKPDARYVAAAQATSDSLLMGTLNLMTACLGPKATEKFTSDLLRDLVAVKVAKGVKKDGN